MRIGRRIAIGIAALVSAPGVLLAVGALAYILYSIATQGWYRRMFAGYGVHLVVLYAAFTAGIVAAHALAAGRVRDAGPRTRLATIAVCVAGLAAAVLLEIEFWPEAVAPHGLFAVPFAAWALVAWRLRAAPPAAPPHAASRPPHGSPR